MHPQVSIKRCRSYDPDAVYESVRDSVTLLGGMESFVSPGERILVKPNILTSKRPEDAVTTHPAILRAVILLVKKAGATPFVGDSSAIGKSSGNAVKCGLMEICEETETEFVELKTPVTVKTDDFLVFGRHEVAGEALEADGIINLPKLKTHAQMYLTLAVKNLYGCVPGKKKLQLHLSAGVNTDTFASMILDLAGVVKPRLSIMDAIVGMEGNGPAAGEPRELGVVLASDTPLAIDRVVAEILGVKNPDKIPILKVAVANGLKGSSLDDIEILGEEIEAVRVTDFKFPPSMDIDFAALLPYFIAKRVKKAMTGRPHIDTSACTHCNICVSLCPAEVMEDKGRIVINYEKCIRCYCCQESCPRGVISVREGWLKRIIPGL